MSSYSLWQVKWITVEKLHFGCVSMVSRLWGRRGGSISGSVYGTWQWRGVRQGWCWVACSIWSVGLDLFCWVMSFGARTSQDRISGYILSRTFFEILLHPYVYRIRFHKHTHELQKVQFGGQFVSSMDHCRFVFMSIVKLFFLHLSFWLGRLVHYACLVLLFF